MIPRDSQCLHLPLPGLPPGRLGIHPPAAPGDAASCCPRAGRSFQSGVGLGAFAALLDLFHLPYGQVLQSALELESLGLCQGLSTPRLAVLAPGASRGCTDGLLQGQTAIDGGGSVHGMMVMWHPISPPSRLRAGYNDARYLTKHKFCLSRQMTVQR